MSARMRAFSVLGWMPDFDSAWISWSGVSRIRLAMVANDWSTSESGTSRPKRLAFLDLQLLVDQFVQHLLARRGLLAGNLHQLRALLDIERGDRVAVDDDDDLLRRCGGHRSRRQDDEGRRQHQPAALDEDFGHLCHRCVRFLDDEGRCSNSSPVTYLPSVAVSGALRPCDRLSPAPAGDQRTPVPASAEFSPVVDWPDVLPPSVRRLSCIINVWFTLTLPL